MCSVMSQCLKGVMAANMPFSGLWKLKGFTGWLIADNAFRIHVPLWLSDGTFGESLTFDAKQHYRQM